MISVHHLQPSRDREREQPIACGAGDLGDGDRTRVGKPLRVERVLGDDPGTGYFPMAVLLSIASLATTIGWRGRGRRTALNFGTPRVPVGEVVPA